MTSGVRVALVDLERRDDYVAALAAAGAEVVLLDPAASADDLWARLDAVCGLCLPGGWDVDPMHYGEAAHPTVQAAAPSRDALELALARAAVAHDVPLLAVCRGMQVLNVALGGSLVQDIATLWPGAHAHTVGETPTAAAHAIDLAVGSRVYAAADAGMPRVVNSRHHQAVLKPGRDLRVTASAPDGLAEAIEITDAAFCVGVQWHPENYWRTGQMLPLFSLFVDAARRAGHTFAPPLSLVAPRPNA